MPTDKRRLLAEMMARMGQGDPAMNAAKMRGVGPDDPIEWEAYGTQPEQPESPPPSGLLGLLGSLVQSEASGAGTPVPQNMNEILLRILGAGASGDVDRAREEQLRRRKTGIPGL